MKNMLGAARRLSLTGLGLLLATAAWGGGAASVHAAKVAPKTRPAVAPAADEAAKPPAPGYLRVVEEADGSVGLEIASRTFVRHDETGRRTGPDVCLVGVAHLADEMYYGALQEALSQFDVVLYESVKPPGTGGAKGATPEERVATTESAMGFVVHMIARHREVEGRFPKDVEELVAFAGRDDPREAAFFRIAMRDAWGRGLSYTRLMTDHGEDFDLTSLGADREPGGEGAAADLSVDRSDVALAATGEATEDRIQAQLAEALDLAFQLDAIDYGAANWRCSDMSIDEVNRAMEAEGADFSLVEGTLAGTSLPAQLAGMMLRIVKVADTFTGGAVSDSMKVVMIEMLGDEKAMHSALGEFDEGFAEVIINQRNAVVIEDLRRIIEEEPEQERIAIFYGAGHMPDLAERLGAMGYTAESARWRRAIHVDLAKSNVTAADVKRLRVMMKRMMWQMRREAARKSAGDE